MICFCSDLHCRLICAPDDGAEVADAQAVADEVDVLMALLLHQRRGEIARGGDDGVARDLDGGPVLAGADDGAVPDLAERGLEVDGDLFAREPLAQVRAVGKADALLRRPDRPSSPRWWTFLPCRASSYAISQPVRPPPTTATVSPTGAPSRYSQASMHLLVAGNLLEHARRGAGGDDDGVGAEGRDRP